MPIELRANTNYRITSSDIINTVKAFISKEYLIANAPTFPAYVMDTGLWGWGHRQISGDSTHRSSPVQNIKGGTNWKSVACSGTDSVAAVTKNGQLWLWGDNTNGKLGDNSTTAKSSPVQTVAGGNNWRQATSSSLNSIGVKTDGTLWVWGNNSTGAVGDNSTTHRSSPVQTVAGGTNWKRAAQGTSFSAGLKSDGTLWTWGNNISGQLGDNTTAHRSSPVQTVALGNNWRALSCGENHMAAIKDDGSLWSWGDNTYGQLGDGTKTHKSSPVQTIAGGTSWKQVSCGSNFTAALKNDNSLWLWGHNGLGRLGTGNTTHRSSPVQTIAGGTDWVVVDSGADHVAAIKIDGTLWAWGNASDGKLGDNTTTNKSSPIQVDSSSSWLRVASGLTGTVAIKDDTVYGDSFYSINNVETDNLFIRKKLVDDGHVWAWGHGASGTLANGEATHRSSPVQIINVTKGWRNLSVSRGAAVAGGIKEGLLYTWGDGAIGMSTKSSPVQVFGTRRWKSLSIGGTFAAAIEDDGTLWTWGNNTYGQLGNTGGNASSPIQVVSVDTTWKRISAGLNSMGGIKTDGSLWMWGHNGSATLGDNSTTHRSSPVQTVAAGTNWKKLSVGDLHVSAIKNDGSLWTWGLNSSGQLGDNSTTTRSSPVQTIAGGNDWRDVSSGSNHTAGIKQDGTLWMWGSGANGRLGTNSTSSVSSPVQTVAGGNDWQSVACGVDSSAAIKFDGSLWTWGNNTYGQLGDETTTSRSSPVQTVSTTSNWKTVSVGLNDTIATRDTMGGQVFVPTLQEMVIYDTSLTEIQLPGNFNPANNTFELIGAGADGGSTGGGGAAWVQANNVPFVAGSMIKIRVSAPGGANTYVGNTTHVFASAQSGQGAVGGLDSESIGNIKYSGGDAVNGNGGGAAGPQGPGGDANTTHGGTSASGNPGGVIGATGAAAGQPACVWGNPNTYSAGGPGGPGGNGSSSGSGIPSGGGGGKGGNGGAGSPSRSCVAAKLGTWTVPAGPTGPGGNGGNGGDLGAGGGAYGTGGSNGAQGLGTQGAIRIRWYEVTPDVEEEGLPAVDLTISANTSDVNLYSLAGSPIVPIELTVTVLSNVTISSSSSTTPALQTGFLPTGSTVNIINNGSIFGRGGDGANGPPYDGNFAPTYTSDVTLANGRDGGPAISLSQSITIDNTNGKIFGGGGGGAASFSGFGGVGGSGGGGGQSVPNSSGGSGTPTTYTGASGAPGTIAGPGNGGPGQTRTVPLSYFTMTVTTQAGGNGGPWGTAGSASADGGVGGGPGKAINLNGFSATLTGGNNGTQIKGAVS
jgi:alpha-tubulin suppressor-like RCC1 family protein